MVPDGQQTPPATPPPPASKAPAGTDGRKEFSVTFYDLDGHSKITQDDIAGLVRNIYAALNDSIAVPQGGKKTIKVHLTVTSSEKQPESTSDSEQQTPNNNNNNNNNARQKCNNAAASKLRKNLNVTIQENLNHHQHECTAKTTSTPAKFDQIRTPNRLSFRGCRNRSPEMIQDCTASPLHHRKKWREQAAAARRAAASIRPDLCELLRENMEENNVNCCRHHHHQHSHHHGRPAHHQHNHHHHHRCSHNQIIDPDCPVLPLYHCNNEETCPSAKQAQNCRSKQCSGGANVAPQPPPFVRHGSCRRSSHQQHTHHHVHHHSRSRSHDGHNNNSNAQHQNLFNYQLLSESEDPPLTAIEPSESKADEILKKCSNLMKKNDPGDAEDEDTLELLLGFKRNNFNSSSLHHQLKHRNREQEHARAMAQVISWLQRDIIGSEKNFQAPAAALFAAKATVPTAVRPPSPPKTVETLLSTPSKNVKKHEHHHVHHHYLHYAKETPIIV